MALEDRVVAVLCVSMLTACTGEESKDALPPPPPTRTQDIVDVLHGVEVADPYRWLEDQEAPDTRTWIDAQNEYADTVLQGLASREELRVTVARVLERDVTGLPRERGGRYFFEKRRADQDLAVLYVRDRAHGDDEILIDPHPMSPDQTISVDYADISADGSLVAYAGREGGVDEVSIRLMEVDAREDLPDVLPEARYGAIWITPDNRGMFYERYGDVTPTVMYHEFGTERGDDVTLFGEGYLRHHIPVTVMSPDGRWLLVHVIEGSSGPTEIHVKDLANDGPFKTAIADGISENWAEFAGDQIVITTNLDAPNKRVVVVDPSNPAVEHWQEVIPERDDVVVQDARPRGGRLAVSYLRDVQPGMAIHELGGEHVRDITFDTLGSIGGGTGRWDSQEVFLTFQTFHRPSTIYRYDVESGQQDVWAAAATPVSETAYEVEQVWFSSTDGSRVPMFVVHATDFVRDGSSPTLLTGYGGFNLSMTPSFSTLATTWLESGGVYVVANMRGGGEFGKEWHRAGMLENKQNVFDDFIRAAEHLVTERYTSPEHLAIRGGSNGGLLVGAVSNQRPDLFGAVVCTYPLLDMVRYHEFLVGSFWVPEYGSSEDPEQFAYIHA